MINGLTFMLSEFGLSLTEDKITVALGVGSGLTRELATYTVNSIVLFHPSRDRPQ